MSAVGQAQQAELFRNKHRGPAVLLLPNAWDAMSARVFAAAGFDAIATTSGGLAWSLGYADAYVVVLALKSVREDRLPSPSYAYVSDCPSGSVRFMRRPRASYR